MRKTTASRSQARSALARARARLFSAASRAYAAGRLSDKQLVRVRITLKGGRSKRCSEAGMDYAARRCILLANELERGLARAGLLAG